MWGEVGWRPKWAGARVAARVNRGTQRSCRAKLIRRLHSPIDYASVGGFISPNEANLGDLSKKNRQHRGWQRRDHAYRDIRIL